VSLHSVSLSLPFFIKTAIELLEEGILAVERIYTPLLLNSIEPIPSKLKSSSENYLFLRSLNLVGRWTYKINLMKESLN